MSHWRKLAGFSGCDENSDDTTQQAPLARTRRPTCENARQPPLGSQLLGRPGVLSRTATPSKPFTARSAFPAGTSTTVPAQDHACNGAQSAYRSWPLRSRVPSFANRKNLRKKQEIQATTNHTNCTNVARRTSLLIRGIRAIRGFTFWFRPAAGLRLQPYSSFPFATHADASSCYREARDRSADRCIAAGRRFPLRHARTMTTLFADTSLLCGVTQCLGSSRIHGGGVSTRKCVTRL